MALLLAAVLPPMTAAKKKPALDTYAIVSGTVFNTGGYALPDVDVTLALEDQSDKVPRAAGKQMTAVSDARGEFVFHVPPGPVQYSVAVDAKGYERQRKSVGVQDRERVEVTFQLELKSN